MVSGVAGEITGQSVTFGPGLAGFVRSEQAASVTRAGALAIAAGQDMDMTGGGAGILAVGRDLEMQNGGAWVAAVGHDAQISNGGALVLTVGGSLDITNGGALVTAGRQVSIQNGSCGILLAGQANLGENTKVVLNTPQALAMGAAIGAVFAVLSWLFRRR
jgi:hypothetical protein